MTPNTLYELEAAENELAKFGILTPFIYMSAETSLGANDDRREKFFKEWLRTISLRNANTIIINVPANIDSCKMDTTYNNNSLMITIFRKRIELRDPY